MIVCYDGASMRILLAIPLFALGLMVFPSSAEAMSCRDHVIARGDAPARVERFCGEPTRRLERIEVRSRIEYVTEWDGTVVEQWEEYEVPVEDWYYDRGPDRLVRRLTFEGGLVREIVTEGYGYRPIRRFRDLPPSHKSQLFSRLLDVSSRTAWL